MGHKQDRLIQLGPKADQKILHVFPGLRVQRSKRFVHQQNCRTQDEDPRQGNPLFHPAGYLFGKIVFKGDQAGQRKKPIHFRISLPFALGAGARPKGNVFPHRQPREQGILLKHHATIGTRRPNGLPIQQNLAAGGFHEPGYDVQQGRLAATAPAQDAYHFPRMGAEAHLGKRRNHRAIHQKVLFQAYDFQKWRGRIPTGQGPLRDRVCS